ncbi:lactate racemase domain-containing protein [Alkalihalobacillus sp. R86527]|uniref:lactate racemase domain-containing protein n=1 Tax=Alkalihalobacillus sp. R86527 TaxID=3093863 RepID=UPI00366AC583
MMRYPQMVKVKQRFPSEKIENIAQHLTEELKSQLPAVQSGDRIAITVGSRGISNRVSIVKTVVDYLKGQNAEPFIIGAMGSHGGGTPEGQMDVLESLGFTEEAIGCPVRTSSTVVEVGTTESGFTLYCDESAWESDGIIVMNRVKLHTAFRGPNESGLLKMITVGLGKAKGANQLHRQGPPNMSKTVQEVGSGMLDTGKILAGIAIVENSYDETAHLEVIRPESMLERERELLLRSREYFPMIPVDHLDVLVVKTMGKNFSGTGMDTNVLGRTKIFGVPEPETPSFKRIGVLDLDESSHGNATGIGLADLTTERLFQKVDRQKTYLNCLTSTYVQRAMIPMVLDTDQELVKTAIDSLAVDDPSSLRVAIIENTLDLETLYLSQNVIEEAGEQIDIVSDPEPIPFTKDGELNYFKESAGGDN